MSQPARKVSQAEMAQRVRAESLDPGTPRETEDNLGPGPDGDWLGVVAAGL